MLYLDISPFIQSCFHSFISNPPDDTIHHSTIATYILNFSHPVFLYSLIDIGPSWWCRPALSPLLSCSEWLSFIRIIRIQACIQAFCIHKYLVCIIELHFNGIPDHECFHLIFYHCLMMLKWISIILSRLKQTYIVSKLAESFFSFKSTLALNVVGAACLLIQLYNQIKRGPCPVHRKCNIWTLSNLVLTICWFEQLFWITRIMIISFECFKSVMNNDHMFEQLFRIIIICWFEQLFWIMGKNEIWFWIIKISYE